VNPRYVVVSPVRDEGSHIAKTIASMTRQTNRAVRWVIVDDGSSDNTADVAAAAAAQHEWITVIRRLNRGARQAGGGVVDAFNVGYACVSGLTWDFVVKLDGDLSFDDTYFERCLARFEAEPQLGIGGGTVCLANDSGLRVEYPSDPRFHVRGPTKIYRRECWKAIAPLVQAPGWDTIDEVRANWKGWKTRTFREIQLVHHKPTGSADGTWRNWYKNGRANYVTGYDPLFMAVKCLKRAFARPPLVAAIALAVGFCSGYVAKAPRVQDAKAIAYLRREQRRRLLLQSSIYD
jgi:biofilm PGA synthesis N-glycosyltransferase PgaC